MSNALTDYATGGAREREQEVCTPQCIADVLAKVWPKGVQLDPCASRKQIVPADIKLYGHRVDTGRKRKDGSPILAWEGPGLKHDWPSRTFFNPPYGDLQKWLAHDTSRSTGETIGLVPVRCRSGWWREWRDSLDAWCELDRLAFLGFKGSFPESLLLSFRADDVDSDDALRLRVEAFYAATNGIVGGTYIR